MEMWDWSTGPNMLAMNASCHNYWIVRDKYAHAVLAQYPWGNYLCVVGPGSCFGSLGLGVGVWAELLREMI